MAGIPEKLTSRVRELRALGLVHITFVAEEEIETQERLSSKTRSAFEHSSSV